VQKKWLRHRKNTAADGYYFSSVPVDFLTHASWFEGPAVRNNCPRWCFAASWRSKVSSILPKSLTFGMDRENQITLACWRNTSRHVRRHVWGHVVRRDAQPVDMALHSFSWTETIYLLVFIVLRSLFVPLFLGYKIPAYFSEQYIETFSLSPPFLWIPHSHMAMVIAPLFFVPRQASEAWARRGNATINR
jgi:hypothetical protein